jgi:hypothetical protein
MVQIGSWPHPIHKRPSSETFSGQLAILRWVAVTSEQCHLRVSVETKKKSHFICNLCRYIQQIVCKCEQWHVEECSVALLCNWWVLDLLWLLGMRLTNYNYKYDNYSRNLVGRSFGSCLRNRLLLSGWSMRFTTRPFGCAEKKQNHPRTVWFLNADSGEERWRVSRLSRHYRQVTGEPPWSISICWALLVSLELCRQLVMLARPVLGVSTFPTSSSFLQLRTIFILII